MRRARWAAVLVVLVAVLVAWLVWRARPSASTEAEVTAGSHVAANTSASESGGRPILGDGGTTTSSTGRAGISSRVDAGERSDTGGDGGSSDAGALPFRGQVEAWMKKNAAEAQREVDRFCDDNRRVKKSKLFPDTPGERDAAVFMLNRVDWEDHVRPNGSLHLPEALHNRIRGAGADWPSVLNASDLQGLDFGWMRELGQFDVWSVASFGPLRDDAPKPFAMSSIPNYVSLMDWAKLRFVLAFSDGDFGSADAEVRHLAALIESQGIIIADSIAVATLRIDARARALAVAQGKDVSTWDVVDEDDAATYRRVSLAGPYFFAPGVAEAVQKKAHECLMNPCSALAEGYGLQKSFSAYADNDTLSLVERFADQSHCSPSLLERVKRSPPIAPGADFDAATVEMYFATPAR